MAFLELGNAWQDQLPDAVMPLATASHSEAGGVRAVVLAMDT